MTPLTDEQIVTIAKSKGYFRVSHRYRDDRLRKRCKNLVKSGVLFVAPRWMVKRGFSDGYGLDPRDATFFCPVKAKEKAST